MSLAVEHMILPDWPAPANVRALQTTRRGGFSCTPYDTLNLGMHVGDDALAVAANRQLLNAWVPSEPVWLEQVHGTQVVSAEQAGCLPRADGCIARRPGAVCAVMTADCLPLLLCDRAGSVVAAVHAGWRGLAAGVIEAAVAAMACPPPELMAWLGPAIGPLAFEVGEEVRAAFVAHQTEAAAAFTPRGAGRWLADIYGLARLRLHAAGVRSIHGGGLCTYTDAAQFYSYRRDGATGRMATLIWLERGAGA